MTSDIARVLISIRSIAEIDDARAAVAASGHVGEVRLRSTPVCYVWDPTREEWEAAARRHEEARRQTVQGGGG